MTITNITKKQNVNYSVSSPGGSVDCGNLGPGDDVVFQAYDNKANVKVIVTISHTGDEDEIIVQNTGL
jgi:sulfate adenylyltransferase subunit 1 (EFTu-like GTPase family)